MTSLIIVIFFAFFALCSMKVALALGLATALGVAFFSPFDTVIIVQRIVSGIDSYNLLAIPLFMLAGRLMNEGGITERIFKLCKVFVGRVKGSLAYVNVLSSIVFSTMSGSAIADIGGLGQIEIKAMNDEGYPIDFTCAVSVTSCTVGPITPPSISLVIYASIAEVSVGALFLAGILPGILMTTSLMVMVFIMGFFIPYPVTKERFTLKEKIRTIGEALLPLGTPIIIMGGIMGGIFTPTEASSVAAIYAFILGFFIYRNFKLKDLPKILLEVVASTSIVTFIIGCSAAFSWIMVVDHVAQRLMDFILILTDSKVMILLFLNIIMLLLGSFMENGTLLILLTPIFLPIAKQMGVDPVHFGLIMCLNLILGVATPPVGTALFLVSNIAQIEIRKIIKMVMIFIIPLIVVLMLVTYVPSISLWIPSMFYLK